MKMTDGKKTIEIKLYTWVDGQGPCGEWTEDFFNAGGLPYDEETETYTVEDVEYCIEQANECKYGRGDYYYGVDKTEEEIENFIVDVKYIETKGANNMKTMYYAIAEENDIYDIGIFATLEEAAKAAKDDREHLTYSERKKMKHYVHQLTKVPADVETLDQLCDACEEDVSIYEAMNVWLVLTNDECRELADNLDWNPTDKEDTLDSLRTNWDETLVEENVQRIYERLVENWEANQEADEE